MENTVHPGDPRSNISKFSGYEPQNYLLRVVQPTVLSDESVTPGCPPRLTQRTVGQYLIPINLELSEVAPQPTIDEMPDTVIDEMVKKDKAFWVDKPGANAYTLHDAYYNYGMTTEIVKPTKQDVFPRSYQYDLDCVRYRRLHACDGLKVPEAERKVLFTEIHYRGQCAQPHRQALVDMRQRALCTSDKIEGLPSLAPLWKALSAQCRDCKKLNIPALTPFQLAWAKDPGQKRWRYYPNLTANLTAQEIRSSMDTVGRPFQNEACNWYYENYPPVKYDGIMRKFSK